MTATERPCGEGPHRLGFDSVATLVERMKALGADDADAERSALEAVEAAEHVRAVRQVQTGESWLLTCPRRFHEADFAQLDQPPAIVDPLVSWLHRARIGTGDNLVLTGPVGTGKTHTAMAAARELHFAGQPMRFVPAPEMLEQLRPDGGADVATFTDVDVLVLDDLGAEKPTEWTADRLAVVLNRRWLDRHATIVTTNLTGPQLLELYGPRTHDRLRDDAMVLHLGGPSRRSEPRTS